VNPGGKLPVSWPRVAGQEPLYYNHNLTHEPEDRPQFTSRYWDISSKPLYPFRVRAQLYELQVRPSATQPERHQGRGSNRSRGRSNEYGPCGGGCRCAGLHPSARRIGFKTRTTTRRLQARQARAGRNADTQVLSGQERASILEPADEGVGCRTRHIRRVGRRRFDSEPAYGTGGRITIEVLGRGPKERDASVHRAFFFNPAIGLGQLIHIVF
jgi:hypothetical protein